MRTTMTTGVIEPLSRSNLELDDQREDIRDEKVYDVQGQEVGKVDELYIDPVQRRTRFISVKAGDFLGMGGQRYLIPVEVVKAQGDQVTIDETADHIKAGPLIEGDLGYEAAVENQPDPVVFEAYRYYKVEVPFWEQGYEQPMWR